MCTKSAPEPDLLERPILFMVFRKTIPRFGGAIGRLVTSIQEHLGTDVKTLYNALEIAFLSSEKKVLTRSVILSLEFSPWKRINRVNTNHYK